MDAVLSSAAWRLAKWLPGALLRHAFSTARLTRMIDVDLRGDGDRLILDCGLAPNVTVHCVVRNGSPFDITLDRARVEVWCEGFYLGMVHWLDRVTIAAGGRADLAFQGLYGVPYGEKLRRSARGLESQISIHCQFVSKVGWFAKGHPQLRTGTPRYVNTPLPESA